VIPEIQRQGNPGSQLFGTWATFKIYVVDFFVGPRGAIGGECLSVFLTFFHDAIAHYSNINEKRPWDHHQGLCLN
jgi:hypothetical protein